jgi:hypothetical protein
MQATVIRRDTVERAKNARHEFANFWPSSMTAGDVGADRNSGRTAAGREAGVPLVVLDRTIAIEVNIETRISVDLRHPRPALSRIQPIERGSDFSFRRVPKMD